MDQQGDQHGRLSASWEGIPGKRWTRFSLTGSRGIAGSNCGLRPADRARPAWSSRRSPPAASRDGQAPTYPRPAWPGSSMLCKKPAIRSQRVVVELRRNLPPHRPEGALGCPGSSILASRASICSITLLRRACKASYSWTISRDRLEGFARHVVGRELLQQPQDELVLPLGRAGILSSRSSDSA